MPNNYKEVGKSGVTFTANTHISEKGFFTKTRRVMRFARAAEALVKFPKSRGYAHLLEDAPMSDQLAYRDIALTVLILFCSLFAFIFVMNTFTKLKRRRKRRAIEYGIKDFMRQVRG